MFEQGNAQSGQRVIKHHYIPVKGKTVRSICDRAGRQIAVIRLQKLLWGYRDNLHYGIIAVVVAGIAVPKYYERDALVFDRIFG
jgi:hypothetical protein